MQATWAAVFVLVLAVGATASVQVGSVANQHANPINNASVAPKNEMVVIGGKPYFIGVNPELTHLEAMAACQNLGMSLVSLESQDKHNEIFIFLYLYYSGPRNYWTSGMRYLENSRNDWVWTSRGQPITFFEWALNQPGSKEQCIYLGVHDVDGWHDGHCVDDPNGYVCENVCS